MKRTFLLNLLLITAGLLHPLFSNAQNAPVILEVEAGAVGADFNTATEGGVTFISITTNGIANFPENENRIVTLEVTFPAAQTYDLYVRFRVGGGTFDDDSFFYGNGFGVKSPTSSADWVRVNNSASVGYATPTDFVGGEGMTGANTWKWLNLSEFTGDETPVTFTVPAGELTQTFQLGAREDGLAIDKIAFGRSDYFFTVANLDNGEEGSPSDEPTARPIAEGKPKFLGNVYSTAQLPGFTNYWNQVTPENAGKWGSVEPTRDNMNWGGLDAAYALAKDNGFPFKLHVLIWGNQQPAWIENLPPAEQLEEIKEWFQALADRYPEMDYIEVVNEPLHDPPNQAGSGGGNYINALGGTGATGWDWVLEAFRLARQYFPNAELMLNDYNIVNSASNTNQYLELIQLLQTENLIDQIGVQAHAFSTRGSTANMQSNLDKLAATGLPIYATEMDIDGPTDAEQLEDYQRIFPVFWEHPAVQGITLWGFRPGLWRNDEKAYLIDLDGATERPALIWLRGYVESTFTSTREPVAPAGHLNVFPNPVSNGELTILGLDRLERAELFDLSGQRVLTTTPTDNTVRLPVTIQPGFYILKVFDGRAAYAKKVMVY